MTEWTLPEIVVHGSVPSTGAGPGGIADAWNSSGIDQSPFSGLVVEGGGNNQTAVVSSQRLTSPDRAQYYSGYWAGVQGALYGFGPPVAPPAQSGGWFFDILGLSHTGAPSASPQAMARALGSSTVSNPFELWLLPSTAESGWYSGPGLNGDVLLDLPSWGPPTHFHPRTSFDDIIPTPPPDWFLRLFRPIGGDVRDFGFGKGKGYKIDNYVFPDEGPPTEQEIQDAGNPALWLSPGEVGPMDNTISTPAPGNPGLGDVPNTTTPDTSAPSVATPGNIIGDEHP